MKEEAKAAVNSEELEPVETEKKKAKKAEAPVEAPKGLYNEETYDITLPISQGDDDEVTVMVNGECTKIQRGVQVTVSAAVFEILQNSMKMDNLAYQRTKQLAEFKKLN